MNIASNISVLIRTFNSARTLERVFLGLSLAEGDEVIVVDSGSTDATLEIAKKHSARIILAEKPFNYSKSLNLGFAAAKNPWVLVISSHAIPIASRFLEVHRRALAKYPADVAVGYGPSTISVKTDADAARDEVHFYTASNYLPMDTYCGNANAIYRRSTWEEQRFDETIRTGEDKWWMRGHFLKGGRIAYVPAARTVNCNHGSLRYMFRKGFGEARARCPKSHVFDSTPHRPMRLYDLGGALKNLLVQKLRGETSLANWLRYAAHTFGQFFGSRSSQNNSPDWK